MTLNWVEVNIPLGPAYDYEDSDDSMDARGLSRAGVLMEFEDGKRELIGHVNAGHGRCDCCRKRLSDAIVKRYAIVWSENES